MTSTLILLRHGESEWNAKNQFTGWVDVDINSKGIAEAKRGAELLAAENLLPDVVHTSVLRRAIHTAYLALDGCAEILQSLERLRAERGVAPALTLVVPTLHRNTQLADEILAKLRERFPAELSRTVLGWSVKVDEAQSHGQTIFEYAPRSSGAIALAAIGDEILARAPGLRAAG